MVISFDRRSDGDGFAEEKTKVCGRPFKFPAKVAVLSLRRQLPTFQQPQGEPAPDQKKWKSSSNKEAKIKRRRFLI